MAQQNTFYYNGTSLTPKVYQTSPDYAIHGNASNWPGIIADATSINGSTSIDGALVGTGGFSGMTWHDPKCLFRDEVTGDFSIAFRWQLKSAGATQIGGFGSGIQSQSLPTCGFNINHDGTGYQCRLYDETTNAIINNFRFNAAVSTGTWIDVVVTYDNSTKIMEVFEDGVSLGTTTGGRFFGIGGLAVNPSWVANVYLADGVYSPTCRIKMDEWAMFNYVLSGAEVSFFDGTARGYYAYTVPSNDTDPGIANVRLGEGYIFGGSSLTGTLALPAIADVEAGVQYGAGGTEFTGTLAIPTLPSEANVKLGIQYGAGGTEFTGALYVPGSIIGNGNWAPEEVQKEIYLLLANDDTLIDLLGEDSGTVDTSTQVFDFVPDDETTPYVTLQILPWVDRGNATFQGLECEFQINVWYQPGEGTNTSRGNKPVHEIQQRIDQLLANTNLCVDGWNSLQLRRTLIDIETDEDQVTKHGIQRFKLLLGEK